jgi:hypothetical protein
MKYTVSVTVIKNSVTNTLYAACHSFFIFPAALSCETASLTYYSRLYQSQ